MDKYMVSTIILDTGDVEYHCTECDRKEIVHIGLANGLFWDVHNGRASLVMLEHFRTRHADGAET